MGFLFAPPLPESAASAAQNLEQNLKKKATEIAALKPPDESEWKERLRALEDRERLTYALVLEGQRKTMEWWLAFLAIFTGLFALGGAFIPFLLARKDKEQLTELLRQAQETAKKLEAHHDRAEVDVADIKATKGEAFVMLQNLQEANELVTSRVSQLGTLGEKGFPENDKKIRAAIETVEKGTSDFLSLSRAKAVKAGLDKDFSAMAAFWQATLAENPQDAQALFGLGWANQMLAAAQDKNLTEARRLWGLAGDFYRQALEIEPDKHEAANNWGTALDAEAKALAPTDLPAARVLWRAAGERYRQALEIKPDKHETANNWGAALIHEYQALRQTDSKSAKALLNQALLHCQKAEAIKPGAGAHNLACIAALNQ